jgi:iron(III) transport system permease protein
VSGSELAQRPASRTRTVPGPFMLFAGLVAVSVCSLIVYPLARIVRDVLFADGSLDFGPVVSAFAEPHLAGLLLSTLGIVLASTGVAVVTGATFAWLNERTDIGMAWLMRVMPVVPLLLPPIAGAIGWVLLAAPGSGFLNGVLRAALAFMGINLTEGPLTIFSWPGLVFVYVLYLVPEVYLTVAAGLRNVDPALEEAALMSGSGPLRTVWKITLPNVKPAIATGATLALITAFSLFSVPIIIAPQAHVPMLSVRIVELMTSSFPPKTGVALVLGCLMLAVIGVAWWLQVRIIRLGRYSMIGGRGMRAGQVRLGRWRFLARSVMISYLLASTVLPFLALLVVSFQPFWTSSVKLSVLTLRHYEKILGSDFNRAALLNSLMLGAVGATVGMFLAAVLAYFVDQNRRTRFAVLVDGITKLPGVVSHLIIGIAFVTAFAGWPFHLHGTLAILFMAYIALYMPQATLTARSALSQIGPQLSEASLMSGASPGRTFLHIVLPLMVPGMIVGWALLFVLIAGEITASSMLAGTRNPVIGFAVLDLWVNGSYSPLAAFGTLISLVMSAVVLTALQTSRRRT